MLSVDSLTCFDCSTLILAFLISSQYLSQYFNRLQLYLNCTMQKSQQLSQHELQLMTRNLELLQRQITQQDESHDHHQTSSPQQSANNHFSSVQSAVGNGKLRQLYQKYLESTQLPANHEEKIEYLLQSKISVGSAMAIFQMVYYFKEALEESLLEQMSRKAFTALMSNNVSKEQIVAYSQLIAQCGQQDEQICQYYAQIILQNNSHFDTALLVLTNQGTTGLIYLIDIASRDIHNLTHKILDYLSRTQTIILSVIIPALIQAVAETTLSRNRDLYLAALNRLAPLLTNQQVRQLVLLINDGSIDKKLLIGTVRCQGVAGQQMLINLTNSRQLNENMNAVALSVLSWRIPTKPALRIKSIEYTLEHSFLPGRFFQYEGSLQPWDYMQQHCPDTLCLSARDFLAHLHPFVTQQPLQHYKHMNNKFLSQVVQALQLDDQQPLQTSQQVVHTLIQQLKNKSHHIRQIALLQLGNIGQPTATIASDAVSKCLNDSESIIRSAACWTMARICPSPSKKIEQKLTQLLRDHFWKVRTSACIAIGLLLKQPLLNTIQSLIRCLQDGSIPKPTVCQTLARMGAEQLLLQILRGSARNDFKLRQAIISSFAFTSTQSPIFSSIIEEILRYSRDSRIQTRELCLLTLGALRRQVQQSSNESLIYFNSKHLLPFYYCFLDDPSSKIRGIAAQNLLSFGPQAQLIFIQGMTKGQPLAKIECIRCLGKLGPQNFRAIALGLRDEDPRVRAVTSQTLVSCFRSEQVVEQFCQRQSQSTSLICNLKEMLGSPNLQPQLEQLLSSILFGLQGNEKGGSFKCTNQNIRWN